jgi:hypothetical protein
MKILALIFVLAGFLGAAEVEQVLMGYSKLDKNGVPQDVQVALTRERMTHLWQRAHPQEAEQPPACDLATGAARYRLTLAGKTLTGELEIPVAVLSEEWQELRIAINPGSVRDVKSTALDGGDGRTPGRFAWSITDETLSIKLEGRQSCRLTVELAVPIQSLHGGGSVQLAVLSPCGGDLELRLPQEWELTAAALALSTPTAINGQIPWRLQLPPALSQLELSWRLPKSSAPLADDIGVTQSIRVALSDGHLEWTDDCSISIQGRALKNATLQLPAGLTVASVEAAGLASWSQDGSLLELAWNQAQDKGVIVHAQGIISLVSDQVSAEILPKLVGAGSSRGTLTLRNHQDDRFAIPVNAAVERVNPSDPADDLAVSWLDQPDNLAVHWQRVAADLRLTQRIALVNGLDRTRVLMTATLSGRGHLDALHLALAEPWRVRSAGNLTTAFEGSGPDRVLVVRGLEPWSDRGELTLEFEADRGELMTSGKNVFAAPDLGPVSGQALVLERQDWVIGDADDRRVQLSGATVYAQASIAEISAAIPGSFLGALEHWRLALQRRPKMGAPHLALVRDEARVRGVASHYLICDADRIRWNARLLYRFDQGEIRVMSCTLPDGATLMHVSVDHLKRWSLQGRELTVELTAPSQAPVAVDLDLELPLNEAANIGGIAFSGGVIPDEQAVALVEAEEEGLLHISVNGLEPVADPAKHLANMANGLPDSVDSARISHAWRTVRADWSLALKHEKLTTSTGPDGVVSLLDITTVIGADGSMRGCATWHVHNRTRQQIPVSLPEHAELWELRVNGQLAQARTGDGGALLIPVRPMRAAEAATRIQLTWYQPASAILLSGSSFTPRSPELDGVRIMQALWRIVPPARYSVQKRDGLMEMIESGAADAGRAERVIKELDRLRSVSSNLSSDGYQRLGDEIASLDTELNDYVVGMQQSVGNKEMLLQAQNARGQAQQELQHLEGVIKTRNTRRGALGIDRERQQWKKLAPKAAPAEDFLPRRAATPAQWTPALAVKPGWRLDPGQPPPGYRTHTYTNLLGIDLMGGDQAAGVSFQQRGAGLDLQISLRRERASWWPWILGGIAALSAAMGFFGRGKRPI